MLISDPDNLKEALRLAYAEIERLSTALADDHPNTTETGRTIMPAMIANWKDQMRRYKTVSIPADWFPVVLDIIERPHRGCFCPHCNPQPKE